MSAQAPYPELDASFPNRPIVIAGQSCQIKKTGVWIVVTTPHGIELDFVGKKWPEIEAEVERVLGLGMPHGPTH